MTGKGVKTPREPAVSHGAILEPGRWYPIARKIRQTCCDCGLKHRLEFKIVKGEIWMRGWRA
jgi:hypothetical protein